MQAIASTQQLSPHERLTRLRQELQRQGLDGFLVPRADEHQGEYIPPASARLAWLTGFTGSAGAAVVLQDHAAVFVDGRYTLQAKAEVDMGLYGHRHLIDEPPHQWLPGHVKRGQRLGYDAWLHTTHDVRTLRTALEPVGVSLVAVAHNPIDAVWSDRPPAPDTAVQIHPVKYAGQASSDKRKALAEALVKEHLEAAIITSPDSVAWLLNVRATDVPHTPLPLSFAILHGNGQVDWFIEPARLSDEVRRHVGSEVHVHPPSALLPSLDKLQGRRVRYDPAVSADMLRSRLEEVKAVVVEGPDPCFLPKACKNPVELEGARTAHRRDGAALCRFLAWVDRQGAGVGEIAASDKLEAFRRELPELLDLSFDTISGAGSNGAIVHYRSSPATERKITEGELYLVDSGAQYADGTTDVTRTVAVGTAPPAAAEHFTLVLQGHIALALTRFRQGISGHQLDAIARLPLWARGLDYDHGTGHGVGSYLGVHEGPQRIAKQPNNIALQAGMIVSNEPGYYATGQYGIRIENLVVVVPVETPGGEHRMLGFETLTLAPIDRRLVVKGMLSAAELVWLNDYHQRVWEIISPWVDPQTRDWLRQATQPI
ncbi:MAG TPA: aminopeptidase P family protein [Candidatus Xenobia bacterium]|jgi:Xaa-Pro aminopeptidase